MIFAILLVGDNYGRLFAGKTDKVPMRHVKNPPGSRLDLEWLVGGDQVLDQ
jgi:hypothetical protein